jgi:hypothetical protein
MRGRGELEEGERADMWARSVSDWKRGEERGAGPRVWWAARVGTGPKARRRREREKGGLLGCGLRDRWAGGLKRKRKRFGKEFSSFYFFSNSFFKLSKVLNSFKTFHLLNSFPKISNQFKDF